VECNLYFLFEDQISTVVTQSFFNLRQLVANSARKCVFGVLFEISAPNLTPYFIIFDFDFCQSQYKFIIFIFQG
jgi:hypothetical protein